MIENYCAVNGKLVRLEDAVIPAADRNFLLGDGIFETLKIYKSKPVWFPEHFKRVKTSAKFADIEMQKPEIILETAEKIIEMNKIKHGYLRITLSRGSVKSGRYSDRPERPNLLITAGELQDEGLKRIKAGFAEWPLNENDPAAGHKTVSRFSNVISSMAAKKKGLDETLFVNTRQKIAEGAISNIFFIKGSSLYTPSLECGILPGIARKKVLELADSAGLAECQGEFTKEEMLFADEIFFTNSVSLITSCKELDGKIFEQDRIAGKFRELLLASID